MQETRRITVRERYEELKNPPIGAPDLLARRRELLCSLPFDGKAFGDHFVDEERYEEQDMLANVLVSCGIDSEIENLNPLAPREHSPTPDFSATLKTGRTIRIELTQFADELVRAYMGDLHFTFTPLQQAWQADKAIKMRINGMHVVFYFPERAPRGRDRDMARDELLSILRLLDLGLVAQTYIYEPPEHCPILRELGATFSVRAINKSTTRVQFRPSLTISNSTRMVDAMSTVLASKKSRHSGYSDDGSVEVWLAVFMSDGISGSGLTAIQTLKERVGELNAAPFARLMIANHVAGLLIERNRSKPAIYKDLGGTHTLSSI